MNTKLALLFKKTGVFLYPYLIILAVCLIIKLIYTREQIYFSVNVLHFPLGDALAIYFTDMGDGLTILILSALFLLYSYRLGFLVASSYLITSLCAQILKHVFKMPRPILYFKDQLSRIYLVKGVEVFSLNSFPSGHTVTVFSAGLVLTYFVAKKAWGIAFLILAVLVGYSRMYLSEHFFEDVAGGSVIGVLVTLCWLYFIEQKPFLQSAKWNKGLLNNNQESTRVKN